MSPGERGQTGAVPPARRQRVDVRGDRAIGAGGPVTGNAIGEHSSVTHTYVGQQVVVQQAPPPRGPAPVSPEDVDAALSQYAVRVRECYGRLDLDVLIPTEEGDHPPVELSAVFVPPLVRADPPPVELPRDLVNRLMESGEWPADLVPPGLELDPRTLERARRAYLERPVREVLDVLADPAADRTVLLGDPGAGKSTLAHHVALTLTGAVPAGPLAPLAGRVPLVVELREYAAEPWRNRTFEDFLDHLHTTKGLAPPKPVLDQLLSEGRVVVLFDGLDELFDPAAREQVAHRVADFASRHRAAGVRVVVTSRVIGYQRGVLERADFAHHMIQDLSVEQIGRFARQWYAAACPHDAGRAERLCRSLREAVDHSRPVRELAGNPLLLTILAIIGRRRELPRDRQGVYRHAVAVLVAHWDEHAKHLRVPAVAETLAYLGDEDRHELLRLVARRMQDGRGGIAGNHIHSDELLATFKAYLCEQYELPAAQAVAAARTMVRQFRERNFILSHYGSGVYGFVHRAFLEYLAAEDIDRRYTRHREWDQGEFVEEVFARHAADPAWHEVLLLLAGQIGEPEAAAAVDRLLDLHRHRNPWSGTRFLVLAVRALAEVRRVGPLAAQSRAVVDAVITELEGVEPDSDTLPELGDAIAAFGTFSPHWSGGPRLLRWFHLRGQYARAAELSVRIACALYAGDAPLRVMAVHGHTPKVQGEALRQLARRWDGEAATWELIRGRAVDDRAADTRKEALRILVERRWHEAATRDLVRERAVADRSEWVREAVLSALVSAPVHDETATVALMRDRATSDPHQRVRGAALRALARLRTDDETLRLVRSEMGSAAEPGVRSSALRALALCWGSDPATRDAVADVAVRDSASHVRGAALFLLDRGWGYQRTVVELLYDRAVADPSDIVRSQALHFLMASRHRGVRARELAGDRLRHDPSEYVRQSVLLEWLARPDEGAPGWQLLRDCVLHDESGDLRQLALSTVHDRFGDDAAARELLRDRALDDPEGPARASALHLFTELCRTEESTWELARDLAVEAPHGVTRGVALEQLARFRGEDSVTWQLVGDRAVTDPDQDVRFVAARLLAGRDEAGEILRARAVEDPAASVRRAALEALGCLPDSAAGGWETIACLAVSDPDEGVRRHALCLLGAQRDADSATRELLRDRALLDPEPKIRRSALRWLAVVDSGDATAETARDRAVADPSADVRIAALRVLAFGRPAHPETLPLIRERTGADAAPEVREEAVRALAAAEALAGSEALAADAGPG
ncbi:HEAT repeat domain-containing protein [Streptomyces luteocolor]|uniref:HEAT repeat domain-containing protein n=2 Tax=Streptomyces TaxID=1883 RepID=UPI000852DF2E|nr:HEAT repeat domain-containing protein [Streptomyces luteocolor]